MPGSSPPLHVIKRFSFTQFCSTFHHGLELPFVCRYTWLHSGGPVDQLKKKYKKSFQCTFQKRPAPTMHVSPQVVGQSGLKVWASPANLRDESGEHLALFAAKVSCLFLQKHSSILLRNFSLSALLKSSVQIGHCGFSRKIVNNLYFWLMRGISWLSDAASHSVLATWYSW